VSRSSYAAQLVWRMLETYGRLELAAVGDRGLKNLKVLVEIDCLSANGRPHRLAHVYKLPFDLVDKMRERERLGFLDGHLLFVSTDNAMVTAGNQTPVLEAKHKSAEVAQWAEARAADNGVHLRYKRGVRDWGPLVDLLDHRSDDEAEHAALVTRCRCGTRPAADRAALIAKAEQALRDGKTRRIRL